YEASEYPLRSTESSASTQATASLLSPSSSQKMRSAAAIAGGVVGALAFLAFLLVVYVAVWRRSRRSKAPNFPSDEEKPCAPPTGVEAEPTTASPRRSSPSTKEGRASARGEPNPSLPEAQVRVLQAKLQTAFQGDEAASESGTVGVIQPEPGG
ncbi:hypothetical protein DFH09DRAFT_450564, partial [Mycena vulgaris]